MNLVELLPKSYPKSSSKWRFTVQGWEAMDTSDRKGNSDYILGKKVFVVRVAKC